jgi:hypothetical protein
MEKWRFSSANVGIFTNIERWQRMFVVGENTNDGEEAFLVSYVGGATYANHLSSILALSKYNAKRIIRYIIQNGQQRNYREVAATAGYGA